MLDTYIVFMRRTSKDQSISSDKIFFEWYYEDVFRKFVANQRKFAAMKIMSRHVEDDLESFSDDDCFLNASSFFQLETNSEAKLEGNYLYHDE